MRILAIDPGYARLGVAVVEGDPSHPVLIMSKCVSPQSEEREGRLAVVFNEVSSAILEYSPDLVAVEKLFFNVNKKTAIGVAEARGAILAAAGEARLPVAEYSPQQVKIAVTGHGNSPKKAIATMIPKLLSLQNRVRLDDELDAIAIGITALATGRVT